MFGVKEVFFREEFLYLDNLNSGEFIVLVKFGYWFCFYRMCRGVKGVSYWVRGMYGLMNEFVMKVLFVFWGFENVEFDELSFMDIVFMVLKFFGIEKLMNMVGKSLIR